MLRSPDIPKIIEKPLLLNDGLWTIKSARVVKWAGLVATVYRGDETKRVAIHYAWWDNEDKLYRIEHNAFARNLKVVLRDLSEEYNKVLENSLWKTSVSETPETLTFLFDNGSSYYEVALSKDPIREHGIFIQQVNKLVIEETNTINETIIEEVPKKYPVSSIVPTRGEVHEILFEEIVLEESLNNILSELYDEGR